MVGKVFELNIVDNGVGGEGIAKINDYTIFVSGAIKGEIVSAKVVKQNKSFAWAKIEKVLEKSPHRVLDINNSSLNAAGCDLMHISYDYQLSIKQQAINNTVKKHLKAPYGVNKIIASDKQTGYRNKAQLPFGYKNNKVFLGFIENNSHNVLPFQKSPLYDEWLDWVVKVVEDYSNNNKLSVYNKETKKGLLKNLSVRKLADFLTISIVTSEQDLPATDELVNKLQYALNGFKWSLYVVKNNKPNGVVLAGDVKLIAGTKEHYYNFMGLNVRVNPLSFFQVNDEVSKKIYNQVISLVAGKDNVVIDAYSGAGLLTTLIAKNAKHAVGIEIVKEAVQDANMLKELNSVQNVTNYCGDVKNVLPSVLKQNGEFKSGTLHIVLDPPRKGCEEQVLKTVLSSKPNKIVYISCNPATLVRDLQVLTTTNNYKITLVQPYDMFPHTSHVEVLVELVKV